MQYQSTPQDRRRAYIIGGVYVFLALVLAVMLFKIWPPIPWPLPLAENATENDKAKLAAQIKAIACPTPTPSVTPTPTPTPPPATNQNSNPTTGSIGQGAGTPTPATTGTRPTATGGRQTGTQTPGQTPPTAAGAAQPGGQAGQQNATAQSTTPPTTQGAGSTPAAATPETNQQSKVTNEIVTIPMSLPFGYCPETTFDERLLLLVIIVGMLGAFVHGATSLADYLGNNAFNKNWTWFYLLRPGIGMALALVFYFAIRGGFLSTTGGAKDINPYGIAALAGMVGMFSKQATDKLGEIFTTLFRSGGDDRRADSLNGSAARTLTLDPPSAVAGGDAFTLNVNGTGFVNGATINVNDKSLTTTFVSATQLRAQVAKDTIANAGTLKVTVINPDQTKTGPVDFVVAGTSDAASGEKPVAGEGGDPDLIDGCDVDMKADTPDEDLPITEGGVK